MSLNINYVSSADCFSGLCWVDQTEEKVLSNALKWLISVRKSVSVACKGVESSWAEFGKMHPWKTSTWSTSGRKFKKMLK